MSLSQIWFTPDSHFCLPWKRMRNDFLWISMPPKTNSPTVIHNRKYSSTLKEIVPSMATFRILSITDAPSLRLKIQISDPNQICSTSPRCSFEMGLSKFLFVERILARVFGNPVLLKLDVKAIALRFQFLKSWFSSSSAIQNWRALNGGSLWGLILIFQGFHVLAHLSFCRFLFISINIFLENLQKKNRHFPRWTTTMEVQKLIKFHFWPD